MGFLSYFQLSVIEISFIIFTVFIASIIRGFNGFGFSATCISLISFILPTIEIVPIILILEVLVSVFMIPYIWSKIDWKFVFQILIGIINRYSYRALFAKIFITKYHTPFNLWDCNIFCNFANERILK